jgi:FKBP-type peptidyl-prolyl cis-trans isomerase 2
MQQQAKAGDAVKVNYVGKLTDGTVFDSSEDTGPLEFVVGDGSLIKGFDQAMVGMAVGETKTQPIPADDAYGPYNDELVVQVDRQSFPEDITPEVGQMLQVSQEDGEPIPVRVAEVETDHVTLDANHPLAGKDLVFDITLVSIGNGGNGPSGTA